MCSIAVPRIDPLDEFGIVLAAPMPYFRLGRPAGSVRTAVGHRRRLITAAETTARLMADLPTDPALVGATATRTVTTGPSRGTAGCAGWHTPADAMLANTSAAMAREHQHVARQYLTTRAV